MWLSSAADGETHTETIDLELPEKIVPDSARGTIAVIGKAKIGVSCMILLTSIPPPPE